MSHLSFQELKAELEKNKGNPVREYIIRNMLLVKYGEHQKRVQQQRTQMVRVKMPPQQMGPRGGYQKPIVFNDEDFNSLYEDASAGGQSYEEENIDNESMQSSQSQKIFTHREIKAKDKDYANRGMINRLNNDLEIRNMKQPFDMNNFQPPYSDNAGPDFVAFDSLKPTGNSKQTFNNPQVQFKKDNR